MNGGKPTNVSSSITPLKGERLTDAQMSVNGLQTRITKAVIERKLLPDTERVAKCLSGMKGNFHVPFLDEEERVIVSSLVYKHNQLHPRKGLWQDFYRDNHLRTTYLVNISGTSHIDIFKDHPFPYFPDHTL